MGSSDASAVAGCRGGGRRGAEVPPGDADPRLHGGRDGRGGSEGCGGGSARRRGPAAPGDGGRGPDRIEVGAPEGLVFGARPGPPLRRPSAPPRAGIRLRLGADAGSRSRSDHGDLQPCPRGAPGSPALSRRRPVGAGLGDLAPRSGPQRGVGGQRHRLAGAEPLLLRSRRTPISLPRDPHGRGGGCPGGDRGAPAPGAPGPGRGSRARPRARPRGWSGRWSRHDQPRRLDHPLRWRSRRPGPARDPQRDARHHRRRHAAGVRLPRRRGRVLGPPPGRRARPRIPHQPQLLGDRPPRPRRHRRERADRDVRPCTADRRRGSSSAASWSSCSSPAGTWRTCSWPGR